MHAWLQRNPVAAALLLVAAAASAPLTGWATARLCPEWLIPVAAVHAVAVGAFVMWSRPDDPDDDPNRRAGV